MLPAFSEYLSICVSPHRAVGKLGVRPGCEGQRWPITSTGVQATDLFQCLLFSEVKLEPEPVLRTNRLMYKQHLAQPVGR